MRHVREASSLVSILWDLPKTSSRRSCCRILGSRHFRLMRTGANCWPNSSTISQVHIIKQKSSLSREKITTLCPSGISFDYIDSYGFILRGPKFLVLPLWEYLLQYCDTINVLLCIVLCKISKLCFFTCRQSFKICVCKINFRNKLSAWTYPLF